MFFVSEHKTEDKRLFLSVFDLELKGKLLEEENKQLDLSAKYYDNSRQLNEEEILKLIKMSYSVEFIGEKSIEFAKNNNLIRKESVKIINNIPYSQTLFLEENN